ncbi:hypothetical protein [Mycobacterium terramassiliense]|uniref:hypothetical protein n=1 Tax=Mycobacterium terramassiliense TaxID=1841859 RepID=UPI00157095FB|nr:hypothetical protein [Mycobacterium terramassiliense]
MSPPALINVVALPTKVTVMSMTAGYPAPRYSRGWLVGKGDCDMGCRRDDAGRATG